MHDNSSSYRTTTNNLTDLIMPKNTKPKEEDTLLVPQSIVPPNKTDRVYTGVYVPKELTPVRAGADDHKQYKSKGFRC